MSCCNKIDLDSTLFSLFVIIKSYRHFHIFVIVCLVILAAQLPRKLQAESLARLSNECHVRDEDGDDNNIYYYLDLYIAFLYSTVDSMRFTNIF